MSGLQRFAPNGDFETPTVPTRSFTLFATGSASITGWTVVGPTGVGNVAIVRGNFTQFENGINFIFPAQSGVQWLDLTGISNTPGEGVSQTVTTIPGDGATNLKTGHFEIQDRPQGG
jgi:hypothetical protein